MTQTMTQMGYQGYAGDIPAAALFPVSAPRSYCTPHRPKTRFHWRYDDFREICQFDDPSADVLRYFEMMTDWIIERLRKSHDIPEGQLPCAADLWFAASYRDIEEGICHTQSYTTCGRCLKDETSDTEPTSLIERGFVERRFIARPGPAVAERPAVTFFEDNKGIFILTDRAGNYIDITGVRHSAIDEGYEQEWQYRYCIERVNVALAGAWHDPPKPMKRWPPIVKRRDPVPQRTGEEAHICQEEAPIASNTIETTSSTDVKVGTRKPPIDEALSPSQSSTDDEDVSTIHRNFTMNIPISSAISQDSQPAEQFCEAPWSPETLIGLAKSRHTKGLFEVTGDDDSDYEGAKKLDRLMLSLGMEPKGFWPLVDQHIMAMMHGQTWYATRRKGKIKRFTLVHVADQWDTVEDELKKYPYYPPNPVLYFGPLEDTSQTGDTRDHSWIFGNSGLSPDSLPEPPPLIIEGSLGSPGGPIEEIQDAQGDSVPSEETEQQDMHHIPSLAAPPWGQTRRGMDEAEYHALCREIWQRYPAIALEPKPYPDGSLACGIEYKPGLFMRVRNAVEWRRPSVALQRAVKDAVGYGRSLQGLCGMGPAEHNALCAVVEKRFPSLSFAHIQFDDGSYGIIIEYAEDTWTEPIHCEAEWHDPPPSILKIMMDALLYGESKKRMGAS